MTDPKVWLLERIETASLFLASSEESLDERDFEAVRVDDGCDVAALDDDPRPFICSFNTSNLTSSPTNKLFVSTNFNIQSGISPFFCVCFFSSVV